MAGGVPFPRPNRMSDDLNRLSCVGHHGHDRQYNCPSFTAKASQTQLWNALLLSLLAMDGVQRGARLGFPIFMPLQSAAKSYRPMAESSSQPIVTNLVPSKQKCLGATPGIYKSRKRRPPYSRYNIRKRRFHLASYPNNFSLANQTNKSILPLRQ